MGAVHVGTACRGDDAAIGVQGVVLAVAVDIVFIVAYGHIVVLAVRAAIDAVHYTARHVDAGVAAHIAADVVAAVEDVDAVARGLAHLHEGCAIDIAHAATAKHRIGNRNLFALRQHMGRYLFHRIATDVILGGGAFHIALVAAAVDVLYVALIQFYLGHNDHVAEVVAAEDGAHEIGAFQLAARGAAHETGKLGVGFNLIRIVFIVLLGVVEQHHRGEALRHSAAVAAAEDGVDKAAAGVDVDIYTLLVWHIALSAGA